MMKVVVYLTSQPQFRVRYYTSVAPERKGRGRDHGRLRTSSQRWQNTAVSTVISNKMFACFLKILVRRVEKEN